VESELSTRNIAGPYRENSDNPSKFRVLAAIYRDKIISGAKGYTPGNLMPASRSLAAMHNTTRPTIEKAMHLLIAEGLLRTNGNQPPIVAERLPSVPSLDERMAALRTTGSILSGGESCDILSAEITEASAGIASALNVQTGSPVLCRRRVTRRHGRPIAYSESYYPPFAYEAASELLETENIKGGAREAAVYALERVQENKVEAHTARMATDEEKTLLELTGKLAIVVQTFRVVYLDDGRPVEAAVKVSEGSMPVVHRGKLGAA
jgi:GntR family transcriptional regulator